MSVGAVIFSRYSSMRLPGKALLDIGGRPLLGRVIDRSRLIKGIDRIIIASSTDVEDDSICQFAKAEGIEVYRGSLGNVTERALEACDAFKLTRFARICGDRPFFDPDLVTKLIKLHAKFDLDVATTTFPNTFAPGLAAEVISVEALRRLSSLVVKDDDKEHVTKYFYDHAQKFSIKNIENSSKINMRGLHLAVDEMVDLERARWIAAQLGNGDGCLSPMSQIISYARAWDELNQRKCL
jgi:spore coat polysaccharide biosynthesis protein SpsF